MGGLGRRPRSTCRARGRTGSPRAVWGRLKFPRLLRCLGFVCSPLRFHCYYGQLLVSAPVYITCKKFLPTRDIPNLYQHLNGQSISNRPRNRRKQSELFFSTLPSAPVRSTIAFTFRANSFRPLSVFAASENPWVSPHPPIATMMAVPFANRGRTASTVVKRGHSDTTSGELNIEERMKARATWVTSDTSEGSGMTLCCLLNL